MVTESEQTIGTIWIGKDFKFSQLKDELSRLGYLSQDGARWTGSAIQARGLHEFLRLHKFMPRLNIIRFFSVFAATFKSTFLTGRSLQGFYDDEVEAECKIFEQIFEVNLSNAKTTQEKRKQ